MPPVQLQPEQAKLIFQLGISNLKTEHATTARVIAAIPTEKSDYRPDPASKTALELAWHIVAAEHRFLNGIVAGAFDFNPIPRPESASEPAGVVAWFEDSFSKSLEKVEKLDGDQLARIIDFRGLLQLSAVLYLQVSSNHTIHHRGQLSTYLRPMGSKVPSIYGESYDAAQARAAREAKSA